MKRLTVLLALAGGLVLVLWQGGAFQGPAPAAPVDPGAAVGAKPTEEQAALAPGATPEEAERARSDASLGTTAERLGTSTTTGALLLRAQTPGEDPVVDVAVLVTPTAGARIGYGTHELRTDLEGLARLDDLTPGAYSIYCPRGPSARADVVAGEVTEVTLRFQGTVEVHGVVRDMDGQAVSGADIWIASWRRDWRATRTLTKSSADGSFVVLHMHKEKSLGATAAGYAPSQLIDLDQVDTETVPVLVELVLERGGGSLTGRVVDPAGKSVGGARVAVGGSTADFNARGDGTMREDWGARVALTDAAGTFAFDGLPAGIQALHVSAEDFPLHTQNIEVPEGGAAHTEVQLVRGMRVAGVVRGVDGEPVPAAIVMALDEPFIDPFPTQGPTERGAPFHRPAVRSDESGAYVLDRLPPGEVHLYASCGTSFWDGGDYKGTAQETLEGAAGDTLEWDPALSRGLQIRGQVVYADGQPMGSVFVSATDGDGRRATEHSDTEGRFAIPGLEPRAYLVSVQLWDPPDGAKPLEQADVRPSESELILTASFSKVIVEKGVARVRIDDRAGRIENKGAVAFAYLGGWYYSDEDEGVFSAELPPGRYQARAMSADRVVGTSEWFDLAPGEERDVGTIETRAEGAILVRIRRPAELAEAPAYASVEVDYGPRRGAREFEGGEDELLYEDLLVGPATVTVSGGGIALERREIEVLPYAPTEVEFELRSAELVRIQVSATPRDGFGKLEVSIHNEDGSLYSMLEYWEKWGARLPLDAQPFLPPGRYRVTATTTMGQSARGELLVEEGGEEPSLTLTLN